MKRLLIKSFVLLVATLLPTLAVCGVQTSGNLTEAAASAVPSSVDRYQFSPTSEQIAKWQKDAESGNADSQLQIGRAYYWGKGVPKDAAKAAEWYQKAAAQDNARAQINLAGMYARGEGVPKDLAKAAEWGLKAAMKGDADAQFSLGWAYANGDGVPKDAAKAVEWYQKAASQGNAGAQYNLGWAYANGDGVPKDAAKAVEWYQKAAAQGNAFAQDNLAAKYYFGDGVPKDAAKSVEWYRKAAAQGNADAQNSLGAMYANGVVVPKDATKAVEWYQKAASQGNAYAQYNLGWMNAHGEGVPKDAAKAAEWYQKAALQGNNDAKIVLGLMDANGENVQKVSVTYLSDPSGATLYADGKLQGYTPFTMEWAVSVPAGSKWAYIPANVKWQSGATAKVTIEVNLATLKLKHGDPSLSAAAWKRAKDIDADSIDGKLVATYTFQRPKNVIGRKTDEQFALKVEKDRDCQKYLDAMKVEHDYGRDARLGELVDKFEFKCMTTEEATLLELKRQNILREVQMQNDAIKARQQPTIVIQPTQPMPPVSNSIRCTTKELFGQVVTDCY